MRTDIKDVDLMNQPDEGDTLVELQKHREEPLESEDSNRYYKGMDLMNQPDERDPLVWLQKHREYILEKYPTAEERREYYHQFHSVEAARKIIEERAAAKERGEPLEP